jgi:hypothetical protein
MKLVEVAAWLGKNDERTFLWRRHAVVVAARSIGIYARGADYTDKQAAAIRSEVNRLFPPRREV